MEVDKTGVGMPSRHQLSNVVISQWRVDPEQIPQLVVRSFTRG
jgi:hypothetical protein